MELEHYSPAIQIALIQLPFSVITGSALTTMMVSFIIFFLSTYSYIIYFSEPFVVAFVQTIYTIIENVGSVEVEVNLTRPVGDILDEYVFVNVYDDENSIYIPSGSVLASKLITSDSP